MGAWSRFLDTFFKWDVIERYFPAIVKGMVVTIEVAVAVVITGILARARSGGRALISHARSSMC